MFPRTLPFHCGRRRQENEIKGERNYVGAQIVPSLSEYAQIILGIKDSLLKNHHPIVSLAKRQS